MSAAEPVTLRRYDGDWQVVRGSQRWDPPVLVRRGFSRGWIVSYRGVGVGDFRTLAHVRGWLDSPDGARWLDSLDGAL